MPIPTPRESRHEHDVIGISIHVTRKPAKTKKTSSDDLALSPQAGDASNDSGSRRLRNTSVGTAHDARTVACSIGSTLPMLLERRVLVRRASCKFYGDLKLSQSAYLHGLFGNHIRSGWRHVFP